MKDGDGSDRQHGRSETSDGRESESRVEAGVAKADGKTGAGGGAADPLVLRPEWRVSGRGGDAVGPPAERRPADQPQAGPGAGSGQSRRRGRLMLPDHGPLDDAAPQGRAEPAPTEDGPDRPAYGAGDPAVGGRGGRGGGDVDAASPAQENAWAAIPSVRLNQRHLERHRLISYGRMDPAHFPIDRLRTQLLQLLRVKGWRRVAITSPTKGCGKTFVSANLGLSLARQGSCRTVLMDLDLRRPALARAFGIRRKLDMRALLTGEISARDFLLKPTPMLALGLNSAKIVDSAELLQDPMTAAAMDRIEAELAPTVLLYDLPPLLACDDVIAMLPQVDGVLLVVGGGITTARQVAECERQLGEQVPIIGVILNRAEDAPTDHYYT